MRSSEDAFVTVRGLRWLCLLLLVPRPWAGRAWAVPPLTVLAPSARHDRGRGRRHKEPTDRARQALPLLRRWLPTRAPVAVADSGHAAGALLACGARLATPSAVITRPRLDAALYAPTAPRRAGQPGRPRKEGARLPTRAVRRADPATARTPVTAASWYGAGARTAGVASGTAAWYRPGLPPVATRRVLVRDPHGQFDPQALLRTDLAAEPAQLLARFVPRWQLEATFEGARRHLGVESRRQWPDRASLRTTPALFGLSSRGTLWAHPRMAATGDPVRQAAWSYKPRPTFADALAPVRRGLRGQPASCLPTRDPDMMGIPRALVDRLADARCYAA